jgi:transcriptional regulator with XRE-family HTH domain
MTAIAKHIENAKKAGRLSSRADVARAMHVSEAAVSRWCAGQRTPTAEEARTLAQIVGMPEEVLMAECEAQRAKDEPTREAWLRVARFCRQAASTTALTALAAVTLFVTAAENAAANQALRAKSLTVIQITALWKARIRRLIAKAALARSSAQAWLARWGSWGRPSTA